MKAEQTFLTYREVLPDSQAVHLVFSFWEFSVAPKLPQSVFHEIFPDGCVSLIYRRNEKEDSSALLLMGLTLETIVREVLPGDVYWGARFSPAASRTVLGTNPSSFLSQPISDEMFLSHLTGKLLNELNECQNFADAIKVFEQKFTALKIQTGDLDAKVAEAVKIISTAAGEVKISDVAQAVGMSIRQLQRRFRRASGLTPKQFARVQRFRAAAIKLADDGQAKIADCAFELGFADQAHLNRECVSLAGRSPKSFAEKIKQIEHGNLVQ
ncbi:MAG: helix-turn-helix domain-containing protein [Acidobacteriota bacterium]|nr:helix-turn-helix domain-containing protein [Acidobacteriota bacterium]